MKIVELKNEKKLVEFIDSWGWVNPDEYDEFDEEDIIGRKWCYDILLPSGQDIGICDILTDYKEFGFNGAFYVQHIEIDEQYRNQGYGTAALAAVCAKFGRIYLAASDENSARLYARLGAETEKFWEVDLGNGVYTISEFDFEN